MKPRSPGRLAAIAIGYAVAWQAGELAVWWKNRGVSKADMQAMSGMFAFGDSVEFLAVFSVAAIVPTLLLSGYVGTAQRFWRAYAVGSLVLSSTAVIAGLLMVSPFRVGAGLYEELRSMSVLRVLAAPFFFLLVVPGLLRAAGPSRKLSALACGCEAFAMGCFVVWLALQR